MPSSDNITHNKFASLQNLQNKEWKRYHEEQMREVNRKIATLESLLVKQKQEMSDYKERQDEDMKALREAVEALVAKCNE